MSDTPDTRQTTDAPKPQETQAPEAKVIDEQKIIEEATKKAESIAKGLKKEIAEEVKNSIVTHLSGEKEQKPEENPLLQAIAKNPKAVFDAHGQLVTERVMNALEERKTQEKKDEATIKPFVEDHPELRAHIEYVEFQAAKAYEADPNLSREECIKRGAQAAVEKLGLKKLSTEEKQKRFNQASLPPAGSSGFSDASGWDAKKSETDYIKARQQQAKATRERKAA